MGRINKTKIVVFISLASVTCGAVVYYLLPRVYTISYTSDTPSASVAGNTVSKTTAGKELSSDSEPIAKADVSSLPVTHIGTPQNVRAVYVSSWVAGSAKYRTPIIKLIDDTELNAIVIDIKDSTGRIGFHVSDLQLQKQGTTENRIADIRALTSLLHQKNIYIIGRISVFQDPLLTKKRPEWAITRKSDGAVWKDRKGLSFLDPANVDVHKYIVAIARNAYNEGFDEINFDYVRYPSDGNISDINYHLAPGKTRADNIETFFKYLSSELKKDENIPISADLFGLTTEVNDDMGIGQIWEKALPHFDFLAPMIYPSHYPAGHAGYKNPASYPYEIISKALRGAIEKTKALNEDIHKIRPWLQDFNLGATYTKEMIHKQLQAVEDAGLSSWMMWDPANKYSSTGLELERNP
jgi:hypothetical protein